MRAPLILLLFIVSVCSFSQRIVSLAPNITMMLQELGLEESIVAAVSVNNTMASPVGSFEAPDLESILLFKPDIVFYTGIVQESLGKKLHDLGLRGEKLYVSDVTSLLENFIVLGELTCSETRAQTIVKDLKAEMNGIVPIHKKALILLWSRPYYSCGPGTWGGDLLRLAGMENVSQVPSGKYGNIPIERLLTCGVEIIFIDGSAPGLCKNLDEDPVLKKSDMLNRIEIIKPSEKNVFAIPCATSLRAWLKELENLD